MDAFTTSMLKTAPAYAAAAGGACLSVRIVVMPMAASGHATNGPQIGQFPYNPEMPATGSEGAMVS